MWHDMQKTHHSIVLDSIHVGIVPNIRPVPEWVWKISEIKKNKFQNSQICVFWIWTRKKTLPEFLVWHTIQHWKWCTLKNRQYSTIDNQNSDQQHFYVGNLCKFVDKMKLTMQQNKTIQSPMKYLSIRPNRRQ